MAGFTTVAEALAWLREDTPCLAFAGAGASIPAPACAPSIAVPLTATIKVLAAAAGRPDFDTSSKMEAIRQRLLPESCYGAVAAVAGTAEHLQLWSSYAWSDTGTQTGPLPNAGHHLLARLGQQHALPVLTTNFDCFIEDAATRQGLRPVVGLPDRHDKFRAVRAGADELAVWKLHGSAVDVDTIRSQAADLARSSHRALRAQLLPHPARLLIVGYSGRDFDIFPLLAEIADRADCLWVDVNFPPEHRAFALPRCRRVPVSFEELARLYWQAAPPSARSWRGPIDEVLARPQSVSDAVREQFARRVHDATVTHLSPVLGTDPRTAALALAAAVATIADFPTVADILDTDPAPSVRALLLQSFVNHSMDRHCDAERSARLARRLAWREQDSFGLGRAEIAIAYARVRRFVGTIREPEITHPSPSRRRAVTASARLVADVVVLAPLFALAGVFVRARKENRRHYDALEFGADYVEQLVRLGGMVAVVLGVLPRGFGHPLLRLMWRTIGSAASFVGYMRGVLNTKKYSARYRAGPAGESAVLAAALVGDAVAGAIVARDSAAECLRQMTGAGDAERNALYAQAERELRESYRMATDARVPTMQVKVLLIMRRHGMALPAGVNLDAIVERVQGEADELATVEAMRLLRA